MNIRNTLVLGINTSILLVLGVFCFWLFFSYSSDVNRQVAVKIGNSEKIVQRLVKLRENELSEIARSLATGPVLRSVLSTRDEETIQGVLENLAKSNGLDVIAIGDGQNFVYSYTTGKEENLRKDFRSRFKGFANIPGSKLELAIADLSSKDLLNAWTEILDGRIALIPNHNPREMILNLWEGTDGLLKEKPVRVDPYVYFHNSVSYYGQDMVLFNDNLTVRLFFERGPFWQSFEKRRNELVVIGLSLFFLGIIISLVIAKRIESQIGSVKTEGEGFVDGDSLLEEIENARNAMLLQAKEKR